MTSLLNPATGAKLDAFTTHQDDFPTLWEKMDIALLLLGVKRATTAILCSDKRANIRPVLPVDQEALQSMVAFLHGLGLRTELCQPDVIANAEPPTPYRTRQVILIARTAEDLTLNHQLWTTDLTRYGGEGLGGFPANDTLYGQLAGFPPTAIAAYLTGDIMPITELSLDIKHSPAFAFGHFRLSRQHWHEELEVSAPWAKAIEANTPALYREVMKAFQEMYED